MAEAAPTTDAADAPAEAQAPAEDGGLFSSLGTVVIVVAVLLALMAAVGFLLLRRS